MKTFIIIELCYTLLHFLLATLIKPGSIEDIRKSIYYQTHSPYYSDYLIFPTREINNMEFKKNNKKRNQRKDEWRICKYCKEIKPLRTHHCSICGNCVIKMDHHCPWINNCIGQNNHRYFLLFLVHIFFYTILVAFFTIPIIIHRKMIKKGYIQSSISDYENNYRAFNKKDANYISVLSISGLIIEIFFNIWNWVLAVSGNTSLEYWASKSDYPLEKGISDYGFGSWRKNLFYIFGKSNLFSIIFIPQIKKLPFSGLEISKYIDPNFSIDGINNNIS